MTLPLHFTTYKSGDYGRLVHDNGAPDREAIDIELARRLSGCPPERLESRRDYWARHIGQEIAYQQWPFVQALIEWSDEERAAYDRQKQLADWQPITMCGGREWSRHMAEAGAIKDRVVDRAIAKFYESIKDSPP